MRTDNLDQSSTGIECELNVFHDTDLSRMDFEDNFVSILGGYPSGYRSDSLWFYTDCGQCESPQSVAECIDLTGVHWRDARSWIVEYLTNEGTTERDIVKMRREYRHACPRDGWLEFLADTLADIPVADYMRDGLARPIGTERYATAAVVGYSQGDYALVLYDPSTWSADPAPTFCRLFYDSPVFARLDIDGMCYYLDEGLSDNYDYDRDELTEYINQLDIPESAKAWAIDALPEYADWA